MGSFRLVFIVTFILHILQIEGAISDKRLCANVDCTKKVSKAVTLMRYGRSGDGVLSFGPNEEVTVYSKSAGSNTDLWGVEYKGQRGYVPLKLLKETKIFVKPTFLVDTEVVYNQVPSNNVISPNYVSPNKVSTEPVVVDGTTLYIANNIDSAASVESTTVPENIVENELPNKDIDSAAEVVATIPTELHKGEKIDEGNEEISYNNVVEEINKLEDISKSSKESTLLVDTELPSNYSEGIELTNKPELLPNNVVADEPQLSTNNGYSTKFTDESELSSNNPDDIKLKDEPAELSSNNADGIKLTDESELSSSNADGIKMTDESELSSNNADGIKFKDGSELSSSNAENIIKLTDKPELSSNNADSIQLTDDTTKLLSTSVETSADIKISTDKENMEDTNMFSVPNPLNIESLIRKDVATETTEGNAEKVSEHTKNSPTENYDMPYNPSNSIDYNALKTVENTNSDTTSHTISEHNINKKSTNDFDIENTTNINQPNINKDELVDMLSNPINNNFESAKQEAQESAEPLTQIDTKSMLDNKFDVVNEVTTDNSEQVKQEVPIHQHQFYYKTKYYENRPLEIIPQPTEVPVVEEISNEQEKLDSQTQPTEMFHEELYIQHNDTDMLDNEVVLNDTEALEPEKVEMVDPLDVQDISDNYSNEENTDLHNNVNNNNKENEITIETNVLENQDLNNMVPSDSTNEDHSNTDTKDDNELFKDINNSKNDESVQEAPSMFSGLFSFFGGDKIDDGLSVVGTEFVETNDDVLLSTKNAHTESCDADSTNMYCTASDQNEETKNATYGITDYLPVQLEDLFVFLSIAGVTISIFLWGYMLIDKMRKEGPLIAKINELEKALLVATKENEILSDKTTHIESIASDKMNASNNAIVDALKSELEDAQTICVALEEQVQSLEKELENSTEVGLELNRMLTDVLSSSNGSETLMANVEQLQTQLVEQQATINAVNEKLNEKDTENYELQIELELNNKKVTDLQMELDKMVLNLLKIEEEKEQIQNKLEIEVQNNKTTLEQTQLSFKMEKAKFENEIKDFRKKLGEMQRNIQIKTNEYNLLKDTISSKEDINGYLDINLIKAEKQQLEQDNMLLNKRLEESENVIRNIGTRLDDLTKEVAYQKERYEEADKEKLESATKLEVLSLYFKQREAELQKELNKHQSIWLEKEGEATSTTERLKFMQEEIQNFKTQNASLKQEIISQEVELKSQISVLEKKAHENWVTARQAERKFEDSRQEASQLRNRLTLRERSLIEDKSLNRLLSPLESNGDHIASPMLINEAPGSPPLLYGTRDHLSTPPPLPSLPPFLPPPPGVPFMPPPMAGMPPFMPPPPSIYPGDHRPPPLGRMSSPPINSRYSPDSRAYSPYSRNTPSPTDDEYYDHRDSYNPYNNRDHRDRRDYGRPPPSKHNMRNNKGAASSGSANSNESLEKVNRHNSKV